MKNLFLKENIFKKNKNKAYCVQIGLNKLSNFFYTIFNLNIKVLDETHYFGLYFTLFGNLLNIDIAWSRRVDHAGPRLDIDFLWLMVHLIIYDTRHWDDDKETWCKYDQN